MLFASSLSERRKDLTAKLCCSLTRVAARSKSAVRESRATCSFVFMVRLVTSVLALSGVLVFLSSFYFAFQFLSSFVSSLVDETRGVSFEILPAEDLSPFVYGDVIDVVQGRNSPIAISSEGWGYDIEDKKLLFSIEEKVTSVVTSSKCKPESEVSSPIAIQTERGSVYTFLDKLILFNQDNLRPVGVSKKLVALSNDVEKSLSVYSLADNWTSKKLFFEERVELVCFYSDYLVVSLVSGDILKVSGDSKHLFLVGESGVSGMTYDDGLLTVDNNGAIKSINPPWDLATDEGTVLTSFSFLPSALTVLTQNRELQFIQRNTGRVLGVHKIRDYGKPVFLNGQLYLKHSNSLISKVAVSLGNERQWVQLKIELERVLRFGVDYLLQFLPYTVMFGFVLFCYQVTIVRPLPISIFLIIISSTEVRLVSELLVCSLPLIAAFGLGRDIASVNRSLCAALLAVFLYFYFPFGSGQSVCMSFVFGYFVAQDLLLLSVNERSVSSQLGVGSPVDILRVAWPKYLMCSVQSSVFIILAGGLVLRFVGIDRFLNYLEINEVLLLFYVLLLILLRLPWILSKKLNVAAV